MKSNKFALTLAIVLLPAFSYAVIETGSPQHGAATEAGAYPADASCRIPAKEKESDAATASDYRDLHRDSTSLTMAVAWGADPLVEALTAAMYQPGSKAKC